jgi:hypothetical protein
MSLIYSDLISRPFDDLPCWSLIMEVAKRLGKTVPDYGDFDGPDLTNLDHYDLHKNEYYKVDVPQIGDIVVWKQIGGDLHFGIVVDKYHFLHTTKGSGVKRNRLDNPIIKQLVEGFYRCRG